MIPNVIRPRDIQSVTGLGRSIVYRPAAEGRFPQPVKLSTKAVGWLRTDVEDWLAKRAKASV